MTTSSSLFQRLCSLLVATLFSSNSIYAQKENDYWYLAYTAVHFIPTGAVGIAGTQLDSEEGSATVSDAAGHLLFYTDGSTIWTRQHRPMPNGTGLGLIYQGSATQGALIVQDPADTARYYVFRQAAYSYPDGLGYVVVDMRRNGGLGDVVGPLVTLGGASRQLSEKLTGIVHANGRDTWVLTHGMLGSTSYYAYLVSPTGVSPVPVTTNVGLPHGARIGGDGVAGYLRPSPNGTKLAAAVAGNGGQLELLDFDPATGRPSHAISLRPPVSAYGMYGVEFSADGSKLYATDNATLLYQYDLLAGEAVADSRVLVGQSHFPTDGIYALQRGPDGRIYAAQHGSHLGVITHPEVKGVGCDYQERGLPLIGNAVWGLPNFPNQFATPGRFFAHVTAASGCPGQPVRLTASLAPAAAPAGATFTWDFGDPTSGLANTATGEAPTHTYATAGTFLVRLHVVWPAGGPAPSSTTILVTTLPAPVLNLAPRVQEVCPSNSVMLDAGAPPAGITYRWADGSTSSTYAVTAPGTYRLTATNAAGCLAEDSVVVRAAPVPQVALPADTTVCDNFTSVLLHPTPQPPGTTYRWQDSSTEPTYVARQAGLYRVEVRNPSGCTAQAQTTITATACPVVIPNIITPNGDGANDYWVLQGVTSAEWSLRIFSRWGQQVHATEAYDNRWQAAGLAEGVYYYHLRHAHTGQVHRGWVEVVR